MIHLTYRVQFSICIFVFAIILSGIPSKACTVFNKSNGNTILFGNVENENNPTEWINKLFFAPPSETEFGCFYMILNRLIAGGMNEKGLCFDMASLDEHEIQANGRDDGNLPYLILKNYSTIQDVEDYFKTKYWSLLDRLHIMVMDSTGASLVVEQVGDSIYLFKKNGQSQVMTNHLLSDSTVRNNSYGRYKTVKAMLDTTTITVSNFQLICEKLTGGAIYSTIYDLKNKDIYIFNSNQHGSMSKFNLTKEFTKGLHHYTWTNFKLETSETTIQSNDLKSISGNQINFNGSSMTIKLSKTANVCISIIDMYGRYVSNIENKRKLSGEYSYSWEPTSLPKGIFLCRVSIDGIIETRKWLNQ